MSPIRTRVRRSFAFVTAILLLSASLPAAAASLTGRVLGPDDNPAAGAMVTVFDEAKQRRETVYTDADGSYAIRNAFAGNLTIRARLAGFDDVAVTQAMAADANAKLDLKLLRFKNAQAASDALSASAHNARLPWKDAKRDRPPFVSQCNYCHQVGNASTRIPQSHAAWMGTITKMEEGVFALLSESEKRTVADVLARGFDGNPIKAQQNYGSGAELARTKVKEWLVGDGYSFIHDSMVAADQLIYGTDEGHDLLWILDRATGNIEKIALPDSKLPRGGHFSGMKLPIGVFTGKHGPHSMAQTRDGRIWITNALSSTLMAFDPKTRAFKTFEIGPDALYPHTIRVDANDIVWFTVAASNHIGRFDPKTETIDLVELPTNGFVRFVSTMMLPTLMRIGSWFPDQAVHLNLSTHKLFGDSVIPFPYGIDVHPKDGGIWYAKLYASKIGRLDPKTLDVEEWDTPLKGPRRPRFDAQGILWIPAFDESGLMRFDPATKKFETYPLPVIGEGEYETPYALGVAPKTGDVWLSANNSDRILRFEPKSKTFLSVPSPTRVTVLRDFSFDRDGAVCSSSSNLPSHAIEDGRPSFICVEPDGAAADRKALANQLAR